VAQRVAPTIRGEGLARLGGDEFTILLTDLASADPAAKVARKVLDQFERPFQLGPHEVFIAPSIGIAVYPHDGVEADALMRNADSAMYHAKARGGGTFEFYTPAMTESTASRLQIESDLRHAIERDEFHLAYQAVVDLDADAVVGVEALLRWDHPRRGLVSPADFVPIAEETGLILPIGEWVLRTAARQCRAWEALGLGELGVAVNACGRQFRDKGLAEVVQRVVDETGLAADRLTIELTESTLMQPGAVMLETLESLRRSGVRLSIDDFGTGYSSLSYLKHFPVQTLKIDKSFVRDVPADQGDAAIVRAIIAMGHSLGLGIVAEGVERREQLAFLRELGCDAVQGFLFCRPVPPDEFEEMLRKKQFDDVV